MSDGFYHEGARRLQDRFDSRRLADRLASTRLRAAFTDDDRAFIEASAMFFLATADERGQPDCSYKGGLPGFVRVVGPSQLAFPSYDGNGMYRSLGNILVNPRVGMLFVDFDRPRRLRVNGLASVHTDDELLETFAGAELLVRVEAQEIFPNCPRYIHKMARVEASVYAPRPEYEPPRPAWKDVPDLREVLPEPSRPRRDEDSER